MDEYHKAIDSMVSRIEPLGTLERLTEKAHNGVLMLATTPVVYGEESGGHTFPPLDGYTGIGIAVSLVGITLGALLKGKRGHNPFSYLASKTGIIAGIGTLAWYGIRFARANF